MHTLAEPSDLSSGVWPCAGYLRPAYLQALRELHGACQAVSPPLAIADAAQRWLLHRSLLSGDHGDGVILGASSADQLQANLAACVGEGSGPLPASVVEAFETAWALTESSCPTYFSRYSGADLLEGAKL